MSLSLLRQARLAPLLLKRRRLRARLLSLDEARWAPGAFAQRRARLCADRLEVFGSETLTHVWIFSPTALIFALVARFVSPGLLIGEQPVGEFIFSLWLWTLAIGLPLGFGALALSARAGPTNSPPRATLGEPESHWSSTSCAPALTSARSPSLAPQKQRAPLSEKPVYKGVIGNA